MSLTVAIPSVKTLARATCTICFENYNNTNRLPKVVCRNGHSICLTCLDEVIHLNNTDAMKCPVCQQPFTGTEARQFASNFALLDLLVAFGENEQRFSLNQATCSECNATGGETMFFVCMPCGKKKGVYCDVESPDFDWQQLDNVTICGACTFSKHNGHGHQLVKLLKLRIRRDRRDMENVVIGAEQHMNTVIASCKEANDLAENTVKQLKEMIELTTNCESSLVLNDAKSYIQRANGALVATATSLQKAANRHRGEFKAHFEVNVKQKNALAMHCKPDEEELEKEGKAEEEKKTEELPLGDLVENEEQPAAEIENSLIEANQMNQDVALSQMGLILAVSTVLLVVVPVVQSPLVRNSIAGLFSFIFWCCARLFDLFGA